MECCDNSGSRFVLTVDGKNYKVRGSLTVRLGGKESTAEANSDGSMYVSNKPVLWEADLTFSDGCGVDIKSIMECHIDVTADLIDIKRKYFLTKARAVGRPQINHETGEISGVTVVCPDARVQMRNAA